MNGDIYEDTKGESYIEYDPSRHWLSPEVARRMGTVVLGVMVFVTGTITGLLIDEWSDGATSSPMKQVGEAGSRVTTELPKTEIPEPENYIVITDDELIRT